MAQGLQGRILCRDQVVVSLSSGRFCDFFLCCNDYLEFLSEDILYPKHWPVNTQIVKYGIISKIPVKISP